MDNLHISLRPVFLLFLLLSPVILMAQNDFSHVINEKWKVEFDIPPTWKVTKKEAGYVLGSDKYQGFILVNSAKFKSVNKLKASINKGIKQEEGTELTVQGKIYPMGSIGVSALLEGTLESEPAKAFLISLLPEKGGTGLTCIVVAKRPYFTQSHIDQLKLLARSIHFL